MATAGDGASKVTTPEEAPRVRQIQGVATADVGMVAVTKMGPFGATLTTSFEEWLRLYGGDIADGEGCEGARGFFLEGGQHLYTIRTVHYTSVDTPSSKTSAAATIDLETGATAPTAGTVLGTNAAPFALANGDTIVVDSEAGTGTATIAALAASRESLAENFALVNAQVLTVAIDGGAVQTIEFLTAEFVSIGAATAEEVAAVINAKIVGATATVTSGGTKVTITSDLKGTDSIVNVTGGTANVALGFTTGATATTASNVADGSAITIAELKTIIELAEGTVTVTDAGGYVRISSNTTGALSTVQVQASSTADDELGIDNAVHTGSAGASQATLTADAKWDGSYANTLQIQVAAAASGEAAAFDLYVIDDGTVVESFTSLTMDPDADRYVETVVNDDDTGSALIAVTDLALVGTATQRRPQNATSGLLTGGDDGLTSLADVDFIGSSAGKTALYALDLAESVSLLIVPGRATSAVQNAMISYCEVWRDGAVVALLDPPESQTAAQMVTYVESTAALLGSSEYGAIYWPRVEVLNPSQAVFGTAARIIVPPSGRVAGVTARGDAVEGGVYKPAAGTERGVLTSVLGFETDETLDEKKRDLVFPKRINPLTTGTGLPRFIDGARTLKSDGNFPYLSERRGVIFIKRSIKAGLQFARHMNNDESLRAMVDRSVRLFLISQMKIGAFRSKNPATAFFVDFGKGLNPDSVAFAGKLKGRVGLATQKPAEFIIVAFSQDTRALEAELAAS